MFGIMKNRGDLCPDQPHWYRMHYCGTCKAMGRLYSQSSRLFLNYDVVFLAEVLSLLDRQSTNVWHSRLAGFNCFSLPTVEDLPISLQFAADINVLLARTKILDNIQDQNRQLWTFIDRCFRRSFRRSTARLNRWNISEPEIQRLQSAIFRREREKPQPWLVDAEKQLAFYAEPSAQLTGYCFQKGATAIGRQEWEKNLRAIGFQFGEIVYLLDARADLEKDRENGQFNPLLHLPALSDPERKQLTEQVIWDKTNELMQGFERLPLSPALIRQLKSRIHLNISTQFQSALSCSGKIRGIEKATLPRLASRIEHFSRQLAGWFDPAVPAKFSLTYLLFLLFFFNQQVSSAAVRITGNGETVAEAGYWPVWLMLGLFPLGAYVLATQIKGSTRAARLLRRLARKQQRLKKKLKRLEDRKRKGKKLKWWVLVGIILLTLLLIGLLSALLGGALCNCCSSTGKNNTSENCCQGNNCTGVGKAHSNCSTCCADGQGCAQCCDCTHVNCCS